MPVFNTAANTRTATPVTSYYEGKAIRLGIANKELANEYQELVNEGAKKKIDDDIDNRRVSVMEDQEKRLQEQWQSLKDTEEGKRVTDSVRASYAAYENAKSGGAEEGEARTVAFETMLDRYDQLLPGGRAEAEASLAEQGMTPESYDPVKTKSILGIVPEQVEPSFKSSKEYVEDGKTYVGHYDDRGEFHKDGIPVPEKTKSDKPPAFSPPTGAEREAAETLIKQDERLDNLSGKDKDLAIEWLATRIKQLMRSNPNADWGATAQDAVEELRGKLSADPGFFNANRESLDLGGGSLADNEYRGTDGKTYVRDENGEWQPKD